MEPRQPATLRTLDWMAALTAIPAIAVIILVLLPINIPNDGNKRLPAQAMSRVKQVATALLIYQTDYDNRYPLAAGDAAWEAALLPYCKNLDLFSSVGKGFGRVKPNTNVAGVIVDPEQGAVPIGSTTISTPSEIMTAYVRVDRWGLDITAVVGFADSHAEILPKSKTGEFNRLLATRFTR